MWSFPGALLLFYISAIPAARIVRLLSPVFWKQTEPAMVILLKVTTIPEIDNKVYISFIVFFALFYVLNSLIFAVAEKRIRIFPRIVEVAAAAFTLYAIIVPSRNLFTLDLIRIGYLLISFGIAAALSVNGRLPKAVLRVLFALLVVRYGLKPMLTYDIGPNHYVSLFDYLYFFILFMLTVYGYLIYRYVSGFFRFFNAFKSRITKQGLFSVIFFPCVVTLLFLMTKAHDPIDIYFTFLPAYHLVHGGVPFVSLMSQYGLLYLAPWVLWLIMFPHLPVSFHIGVIITMICLSIYFYLYLRVLGEVYERRLIFFLTAVAGIYFSVFMRYYGFPDPVSLVSTPAFTPLRFGIFIIPFWILVRYCRTGEERYFNAFLAVTAVLFFYSFETGIGILLSGMSVIAVRKLYNRKFSVSHDMVCLAASLAVCVLIIIVMTLSLAGKFPDFVSYTYFSSLYGTGFLMLPINTQTVSFILAGTAIAGGIFGIRLLVSDDNSRGYLYWYLACITLVELPYYMGRTVPPTIYNVSLPFILLCGLFAEEAFHRLKKTWSDMVSWTALFVCGYIIVIGGVRGTVVMGNNLLHAAEIGDASARFIRNAVYSWEVKRTPQYIFLRNNLPSGCPLASFDDTYEYVPAIGVPQAFNYPFMRGIIASREEVDRLLTHAGASRVCLFIDQAFLDKHDDLSYGIYLYFWHRYGMYAREIANDSDKGFTLYTFPSGIFPFTHN